MSRFDDAMQEQAALADQADYEMQKCMQDMEQMYVESLRRVVQGVATLEDAKVLASGCGIDFSLIT